MTSTPSKNRIACFIVIPVHIVILLFIANRILQYQGGLDYDNMDRSTVFTEPVHFSQQKAQNDKKADKIQRNAKMGEFTLPMFNKSQPVIHLHIPKTGGSSLDETLAPIINYKLQGVYTGGDRKYDGVHFDWSVIQKKTLINHAPQQVITMFRNPVDRAISHYYFTRKFNWTKDKASRTQTISEYLDDYDSMLKTRDIWQDGQGGVSWLSGTHIAKWAVKKGLTEKEIDKREIASLDYKKLLKISVERMNKLFWFGVLEKKEKSLELLKHQLGLDSKLVRGNRNNLTLEFTNVHTKPVSYSSDTKQKLSYFMPLDLWLYGYANELFEARYELFKTGVWKAPVIPDFPEDLSCQSTRFVIRCKEPKMVYHVWDKDRNVTKVDEIKKLLPEN